MARFPAALWESHRDLATMGRKTENPWLYGAATWHSHGAWRPAARFLTRASIGLNQAAGIKQFSLSLMTDGAAGCISWRSIVARAHRLTPPRVLILNGIGAKEV